MEENLQAALLLRPLEGAGGLAQGKPAGDHRPHLDPIQLIFLTMTGAMSRQTGLATVDFITARLRARVIPTAIATPAGDPVALTVTSNSPSPPILTPARSAIAILPACRPNSKTSAPPTGSH
ncbi:MAG: hypothetical protein ACK527_22540 [Acidobacteriota bacterium]|jgi:hypothetical protein